MNCSLKWSYKKRRKKPSKDFIYNYIDLSKDVTNSFKVLSNIGDGFQSINTIYDFDLSLFSAVTSDDSVVKPTTEPALFINILIQFLSWIDKLSPAAKHRMKTSRDVLIKNSSCQTIWISKKEESWQDFFSLKHRLLS